MADATGIFDREVSYVSDPVSVYDEESTCSVMAVPAYVDVQPRDQVTSYVAGSLHSTSVPGKDCVYVKESDQISLLNIETLSRTKSQFLMTGLYLIIVMCIVVSGVDYALMWECTNICGFRQGGARNHKCGADTSASCMRERTTVAPPSLEAEAETVDDAYFIPTTTGGNGTRLEVEWSGRVTGLRVLNRFLHMTFSMANPNLNNMSVVEVTKLQMRQVVYTSGRDRTPFNKTFDLALSCAFNQARCSTLQVPVSDMPWAAAYNISIVLLDPPTDIVDFLPTASVLFQYQKSAYTRAEIVFRLLMIVYTVYGMHQFVKRLHKVPFYRWLTEQVYIVIAFAFLILYLDPFYLLATFGNPHQKRNGGWAFLNYLEFHASTYFLLFMQVLVVILLTSVRRTDGHVRRTTHVVSLVWFLYMFAFDLYIATKDNDHGDYSSTFLWFLFAHSVDTLASGEAALVLIAIVLQVGWLIWTVRGMVRAKNKLRLQPYFPTRHRQLAYRYLVFLFGGMAAYQVATFVLSVAINQGFASVYRSSQELGAVFFAFFFIHILAYIYRPAFDSQHAPPAPFDPSWRDATWKSVRWRPEWYEWLLQHGGSLYFFVRASEQDRYLEAQKEVDMGSHPSGRRMHGKEHARFSLTGVVDHAARVGNLVRSNLFTKPLRKLENALFSEGYQGCPRLFFCLEICTYMLNLSYAVYVPLHLRHYPAAGRRGTFTAAVLDRIDAVRSTLLTLAGATAAAVVEAAAAGATASDAPEPASAAAAEDAAAAAAVAASSKPFNLVSLVGRITSARATVSEEEPSPAAGGATGNRVSVPPAGQAEDHLLHEFGYELFDAIEVPESEMLVMVCIARGNTGAQHVAVVFRGTSNVRNAYDDLRVYRREWEEMAAEMQAEDIGGGRPLLHSGFQEVWDSIKVPVMQSITEALALFTDRPVLYITGHSLGGAIANLCAYSATVDLHLLPVVYTFGCPKMGNKAFQKQLNATVPNTFRVVNEHDFVAHWSFTCGNCHVGREVCVSKGNLLVEPTWIEQTFQPTKRGGTYISHSLTRYAQTINLLCKRYHITENCLRKRSASETASDTVSEAIRIAKHVELDTCASTSPPTTDTTRTPDEAAPLLRG